MPTVFVVPYCVTIQLVKLDNKILLSTINFTQLGN